MKDKIPHVPKEILQWCYCDKCIDYWQKEHIKNKL